LISPTGCASMDTKKALIIAGIAIVPGGLLALGVYWLSQYCSHEFSMPHPRTNKEYYVVCMKCTHAYEYDWHNMRVGKRLPNVWDSAHPTSHRAPSRSKPVV